MKLMKSQESRTAFLARGKADASLFPCTGELCVSGAFLSHRNHPKVPIDVGGKQCLCLISCVFCGHPRLSQGLRGGQRETFESRDQLSKPRDKFLEFNKMRF